MEQGSTEWKKWRGKGIGSSDAPVIMGVSPWRTPLQLWKEKTGKETYEVNSFAMQRGNDLEPVARSMFELETGREFPAYVMEHKEHSFIRASYDGLCQETHEILEIKCPGKADHGLAKAGKVPSKYYPQVQHLLMVSGGARGWYYSFDGKTGVTVEVPADKEYQAKLLKAEIEFWEMVQKDVSPPVSEKDYQDLSTDDDTLELFEEYKKVATLAKQYKAHADSIREMIKKIAGKRNVTCANVWVTYYQTKGAVDYDKLLEDNHVAVDIEAYRKVNKEGFRFTIKE